MPGRAGFAVNERGAPAHRRALACICGRTFLLALPPITRFHRCAARRARASSRLPVAARRLSGLLHPLSVATPKRGTRRSGGKACGRPCRRSPPESPANPTWAIFFGRAVGSHQAAASLGGNQPEGACHVHRHRNEADRPRRREGRCRGLSPGRWRLAGRGILSARVRGRAGLRLSAGRQGPHHARAPVYQRQLGHAVRPVSGTRLRFGEGAGLQHHAAGG